jgi:hypothetical protein
MLLMIVGIVAIVGIVCMIVVMPKASTNLVYPPGEIYVDNSDATGQVMSVKSAYVQSSSNTIDAEVHCSNSCLNYWYKRGGLMHFNTCCGTSYGVVKHVEAKYKQLL